MFYKHLDSNSQLSIPHEADIPSYGLANGDLTDGGKNDRFRLDLSAVSGSFNVIINVHSAVSSDGSRYQVTNVSSSGLLEIFFKDFVKTVGNGANFRSVKQVSLWLFVNNGDAAEIESFVAYGPDTTPPKLTISGKNKLLIPQSTHLVKGKARVDEEVTRVEVKTRGAAPKLAELQSNGKWTYRARRLKSGRNRSLIRALDSSGSYSPFTKVKVERPLR